MNISYDKETLAAEEQLSQPCFNDLAPKKSVGSKFGKIFANLLNTDQLEPNCTCISVVHKQDNTQITTTV